MKPYYKNNGFFDRLERLSDWIDNQISRPFTMKRIAEEIDECIGCINRLNRLYRSVNVRPRYMDRQVVVLRLELFELRWLYNREKYWWMRAK